MLCSHVFRDSHHCLLCGFTPPPAPGTIALLTQSLYEARLQIETLTEIERTLRARLAEATASREAAYLLLAELEAAGKQRTAK